MPDVRLYHTYDGGEIDLAPDGTYTEVLLDTGLETAAYLSLFGGNERDPGLEHDDNEPDHPHQNQWWGNLGEPDHARHMHSETAFLLKGMPATTSNLVRVEQAADRDLAWFIEEGVASEVEVTAILSGVDSVTIQVRFVVNKQEFVFAFRAIWGN